MTRARELSKGVFDTTYEVNIFKHVSFTQTFMSVPKDKKI